MVDEIPKMEPASFDYAREQEKFLREAIGNELFDALEKLENNEKTNTDKATDH